MPVHYTIRSLPDGPPAELAGERTNYYEFSDSERFDFYAVPVWCPRCGKITVGEELPTLAEIDLEIRDLPSWVNSGGPVGLSPEREAFLQRCLTGLQQRRRWREERKSPPKCLHCGTTDIVQLPIDVPIPNPYGDGMIQIDCFADCPFYIDFPTDVDAWFFTPEGDRILRETPERTSAG